MILPIKDLDLKTIVKENYATLYSVSKDEAEYLVEVPYKDGYVTVRIAVPLNDIGNARLKAKEKAILLMRWVRKAIESNELVFISQTINQTEDDGVSSK